MTVATTDLGDLSYEQAREELLAVVARLESGAVPLEESLRLWERGEALAARCDHLLAGARARLGAVLAPNEAPLPTADAPAGAPEPR